MDQSQGGFVSDEAGTGKEGTNCSSQGFNMASMGTALPHYNSSQNYPFSNCSHSSQQQQQQQQLAGQAQSPHYNQAFSGQLPVYGFQNTAMRTQSSPMQPQYHGQAWYPGQQPMFYQQYPQSPQYFSAGNQRLPENVASRAYQQHIPPGMSPTWSQYSGDYQGSQASSGRSIPSVPRGPPRKPKQSGHALWVGNLPPGALVNDLKDHFSRDATEDIESVFLISKSNCAFVNYKTEEACAAAMGRFHDSRFSGVRLVCRLRRMSTNPASPTSGIPTAPAASFSTAASAESQTAIEAVTKNRVESTKAVEANNAVSGSEKINDKYFVVKSLTVEDLELSARNGIWATQAHNEETLNKAYKSVENVYLIFSANKSGEYFGYARMTSPINEESAVTLDWKPRAESPVTDSSELPRSIPTPATVTAPKGHIIDDSARGTIFWEADTDSADEAEGESKEPPPTQDVDAGIGTSADTSKSTSNAGDKDESPATQPYGHPFRIQWLSTNRLPFYRTRGLRNPWNSNREVKIARDGTELETGVGRRLINMFNMPVPPPNVAASRLSISPSGMQGGYSPQFQQPRY